MRRVVLIVSLFALQACGSVPPVPPTSKPVIDDDFKPALSKFEKHFNIEVNISFHYVSPEVWGQSDSVGRCVADIINRVEVSPHVKTNYWRSPEHIEVFVFHELGHCILNRNHDNRHQYFEYVINQAGDIVPEARICYDEEDKVFCSGVPLSIMRWRLFTEYEIENFYKNNREFYWNQILEAPIWRLPK